jgi:hypothetical protein
MELQLGLGPGGDLICAALLHGNSVHEMTDTDKYIRAHSKGSILVLKGADDSVTEMDYESIKKLLEGD